MSPEWYFQTDGTVTGPITAHQLRRLAEVGKLAADNLVRKTADGRWVRAGDVNGLSFGPSLQPEADTDESADGAYAFAGEATPESAAGGRKRRRLRADHPLVDFAVGAGGIVAVGASGWVGWWDAATGKLLREWDGPAGAGAKVDVAAGADRAVVAVETKSGLLIKQWRTELFTIRPDRGGMKAVDTLDGRLSTLAIDADGREVAAVDAGSALHFWNSEAKTRPDAMTVKGAVHELLLDQNLLAVGDSTGNVAVWNIARGKKRLELSKGSQGKPACGDTPHRFHFSATAGRLLTSSGKPVYNTQKGGGMVGALAGGIPGAVIGGVLEEQGEKKATERRERVTTMRCWDLYDGAVLSDWPALLKVHPDSISGTALSPDGRRAVTVGFDNSVRAWAVHDTEYSRTIFSFDMDVPKGKKADLREQYDVPHWWVRRAAFTADGTAVVVLLHGDDELYVIPWPRDIG